MNIGAASVSNPFGGTGRGGLDARKPCCYGAIRLTKCYKTNARSISRRQTMKIVKQCTMALLAGLLALGATAATVDVGGVKVEDSTDVRGSKLVLNGAGVRYKAVFKV